MRTSACSCAVFWGLLGCVWAQEPKIPAAPLPNELIGRWLEKTLRQEGDLVGYNVYCFDRQSEFLVLSLVRNEKTQTWEPTKKLYGKERHPITGYVEATTAGHIEFPGRCLRDGGAADRNALQDKR